MMRTPRTRRRQTRWEMRTRGMGGYTKEVKQMSEEEEFWRSREEEYCREGRDTGYLSKPEWMSIFEWLRCTPCAICGRRYWEPWSTPDEDWARFIPEKYQHQEVCECCYLKLRRRKLGR